MGCPSTAIREAMDGQAPHMVIFPCPGISHLIPHAELAKQLALRHGLSVTLLTISGAGLPTKGQDALLDSLPAGVDYVALPPVDLPADSPVIARVLSAVRQSLPALATALVDLKQRRRIVAFVADPFCLTSFDIAKNVGLPPYVFYTSNLFHLSLYFHLGDANGVVDDLTDPLEMPGCIPLYHRDLPDSLRSRNPQFFGLLAENARRLREAEGILVNSFHDLEPETLTFLKNKDFGRPPVYAIGPLVHVEGSDSSERCLRWLDEQPEGSVMYISFGSIGAMTQEQINELALGLEQSGQRFLWVIRRPADKVGGDDDPLHYLPEGFAERTKDRGFLEIAWAPQAQILSHPATEGFLTHCGWNSTLESIINGVAMIAWPMYAEQKMNASMLEKAAKMAIRVSVVDKEDGGVGVVGKEEIARVVKELLEGEQGGAARENVKKLQAAAALALTEKGSSFKALAEVATGWKGSTQA